MRRRTPSPRWFRGWAERIADELRSEVGAADADRDHMSAAACRSRPGASRRGPATPACARALVQREPARSRRCRRPASGVSSCWRSAVCNTGRPSDRLIFSPLNSAEDPFRQVALVRIRDEGIDRLRCHALLRPVGEPLVPRQRQPRKPVGVGGGTARSACGRRARRDALPARASALRIAACSWLLRQRQDSMQAE